MNTTGKEEGHLKKLMLLDLRPAFASQIGIALEQCIKQGEQRFADSRRKRGALLGVEQAIPGNCG